MAQVGMLALLPAFQKIWGIRCHGHKDHDKEHVAEEARKATEQTTMQYVKVCLGERIQPELMNTVV
jgi:hypothetical protein